MNTDLCYCICLLQMFDSSRQAYIAIPNQSGELDIRQCNENLSACVNDSIQGKIVNQIIVLLLNYIFRNACCERKILKRIVTYPYFISMDLLVAILSYFILRNSGSHYFDIRINAAGVTGKTDFLQTCANYGRLDIRYPRYLRELMVHFYYYSERWWGAKIQFWYVMLWLDVLMQRSLCCGINIILISNSSRNKLDNWPKGGHCI